MKFENLESIRSLAVVGATGLVGTELLELLAEHKIKIPDLRLFASPDSEGEAVSVGSEELAVEALKPGCFNGVEVAFFSVPAVTTKQYVPQAVESGALVVDDSSVYRLDKEVALVVPEVNGAVLREYSGKILSVPNCTTTPLVMCLKPLEEAFGLERVVVSTYQSVSGAGQQAYQELSEQTIALLNGMESESQAFPHRIAFNLLPQIGEPVENGNTTEEEKVIRESRKILALPNLRVSSTAVRVPTFFGHGLSVNIEFKKEFGKVEAVRELLDTFPGIKVVDQPAHSIYPTNVESAGSDYTFVGRIRRDNSVPSGINLWIITDNLRKGAALNALQCLETLYKYRRMI